jgi:hypothetical protein
MLGERLELKAQMPPESVLGCLAKAIDPWKLGLIADAPGDRDFIGWVKGARFQVRRRHRFGSWNRYAPTAVGRVTGDGRGSVLEARFRGDPWNRFAFLALLGALYASTFEIPLGVGEAALIAAILGFALYQMELAKGTVRQLLRECMSEPARPLQWVMS